MNKIFNLLENITSDNATKFQKIIYNFFIPYFLLLEYICYYYYWKKIILAEILTSDKVVEFLDKNEFGYVKSRIVKADLLESNDFYDRMNLEESRQAIRKEFTLAFAKLFEENILFNIENYVTLKVETEVKLIKKMDEVYKAKIFIISLQFCRDFYLVKALRKFIVWLIIFSGISILLLIYFQFIKIN